MNKDSKRKYILEVKSQGEITKNSTYDRLIFCLKSSFRKSKPKYRLEARSEREIMKNSTDDRIIQLLPKSTLRKGTIRYQ